MNGLCKNCNQQRELADDINCQECIDYINDLLNERNSSRNVIITREMAMDAGDPSMEGHTWQW